jgi:hypothetical protein
MDYDYPSQRWFWQHLTVSGRERALAELWVLLHFAPRDEQESFWRSAEIARIEGNLDVPRCLDVPDEDLLFAARQSQARRLRAWLRQGERLRDYSRYTYPDDDKESK